MKLGAWQLDTVSGGKFRLDGGAMFGVVPKVVWQKQQPADDLNRIHLATNCVLARNGDVTLLVDTGYGGKCSAKECQQMEIAAGEPLLASLAALGVAPDEIDIVLLSHLHFDHAGGGTQRTTAGDLQRTFPRATYIAAAAEWEDATSGHPELRGAYPAENLSPLAGSEALRLVDDGETITPGVIVRRTGGHTRGHHAILISSGNETAAYLGDICPTHSHMPSHWNMGYDTFPLDTRRQKPKFLGQAADENWLILWDHDPDQAAARIARDPKREFIVVESFATL